MVYHGRDGQLEYDFVVAPHADAQAIEFSVEGNAGSVIRTNGQGDLEISTGGSELLMHRPEILQGSCVKEGSNGSIRGRSGCRKLPSGEFVVMNERTKGGRVEFRLPEYDHEQTLVIDPVVLFSTFLGGENEDQADGIAVDPSGNIYISGQTTSTHYPVTSGVLQTALNGQQDIVVTKMSGDGSRLIYSTYLGGSSTESGGAIAVDATGNAYITGQTSSTDFPTVNAFQSGPPVQGGAFVTKLSADGTSLVYSTYLAGSHSSRAEAIAVNANGEAVVCGSTVSTDFPVQNAYQATHAADGGLDDAFVSKFSADGMSLIFSTYIGGTSEDEAEAVAYDPSGAIYVGGRASPDFPTIAGAYLQGSGSSFISKFSATGSGLEYSTLFPAEVLAITVNNAGNVYATGQNETAQFPVTAGAYQTRFGQVFASELSADGSSLVFSTMLGGVNGDEGKSIAVDSSGDVYVTGQTNSTNFPVQLPVDTFYSGVPEGFVSEFNSSGTQLLFSTFVGGGQGSSAASEGDADYGRRLEAFFRGGNHKRNGFPFVECADSATPWISRHVRDEILGCGVVWIGDQSDDACCAGWAGECCRAGKADHDFEQWR